MSRRERSGNPRYLRPLSAASSSETKEEVIPCRVRTFPPSSGLCPLSAIRSRLTVDRSGTAIIARGCHYFVCPFSCRDADLPFLQFPAVIAETQYETETKIVVQTVTVPPPANTRLAPPPYPESASSLSTASSPRTTAVLEMVEDDEGEDPRSNRGSRTLRKPPPARWLGGW